MRMIKSNRAHSKVQSTAAVIHAISAAIASATCDR